MKFTVENLGKVGKAEIDLKPLTIFIGKNGSGKTYVASALWAYISYLKNKLNFKELLSERTYNEYVYEINNKIEEREQFEASFNVKEEQLKQIHQNIQNVLNKNVDKILNHCFRYEVSDNSFFCLNQTESSYSDFTAKIILEQELVDTETDSELGQRISWNVYKITCNKLKRTIRFPKDYSFSKRYIVDLIIGELISHVIFKDIIRSFDKITYIPAARTGLMFGLHNFAQRGLEDNPFGEDNLEYTNLLTAPLSNFISEAHKAPLLVRRLAKKPFNDKKDKLDNLLGGKINVDENFRYQFIPNFSEKAIPLSATSSLVTEVSALEIFKYKTTGNSFVIFEEPEAHLHLSAQRKMAKIIAKMINQGCHMLITTHSDTFLQQLNNLIMLNQLAEHNPDVLQDFNIEKGETLAGDKVAVYDFQCKNEDKSTAIALELGEYGFIAPSVNDEIDNLIQQTDTIIDMIDDLKSNGE